MDMDDLRDSIAQAMQQMSERSSEENRAPKQDPAILAFTLQEAAQRHAKGCPFKPGDLVTPRKGYNLKGAGEPHVVMEIMAPEPQRGEAAEKAYMGGIARIYDMRVLSCVREDLIAYYAESYCYEAWKGDVAKVN